MRYHKTKAQNVRLYHCETCKDHRFFVRITNQALKWKCLSCLTIKGIGEIN